MNLFKIFKNSLYKFDEYINLINISNAKTVFYTLFLSFIITFVSVLPLGIFYSLAGGASKIFENYIPDFKIENNLLSMPEILDYSSSSSKILIDTKNEHNISDFSQFKNVVLVSSDKITLKSFDTLEELSISQVSDTLNIYSKSDLINNLLLLKSLLYYFMFSVVFVIFLLQAMKLFFVSLILAFLIKIFYRQNLSFNKIFKLSLFANTMPALLSTLLNTFRLSMPTIVYLVMFLTIVRVILNQENFNTIKTEN